MILAEMTELLFVAATATPSPTPSADPTAMYPKDWWTVGVGVTAGLGGALIAGFVQAWKAKHDQRVARDSALWEYHRVLNDISADISAFLGDTVEGYDDGNYRDRVKTARQAAYPYFQLFPKKDRLSLTYPTANDRYQGDPRQDQEQVDRAIDALERFLMSWWQRRARAK